MYLGKCHAICALVSKVSDLIRAIFVFETTSFFFTARYVYQLHTIQSCIDKSSHERFSSSPACSLGVSFVKLNNTTSVAVCCLIVLLEI